MSYSGLLINRVAITRPSTAYVKGRPTKTAPLLVASDVHCRIQYVAKEDIYPKTQGYEYASGWNGFFEYGVDLQKDDRLTDERSRVFIVQSDPTDVTGMSHHPEAKLELVE